MENKFLIQIQKLSSNPSNNKRLDYLKTIMNKDWEHLKHNQSVIFILVELEYIPKEPYYNRHFINNSFCPTSISAYYSSYSKERDKWQLERDKCKSIVLEAFEYLKHL